MASGELIIDQAGATGPVNRLFRQTLDNPALRMELGEVATAREEHVGARLGDLDHECPDQWADKRLISLDDLASIGNGAVVFSGLQAEPAAKYEDRLAEGRLVVTNASANRTRPDVPVANAFLNAHHIDELYADTGRPGYIVAGGNCTSNILATPLFPLYHSIGVQGLTVETLQGWSGAGQDEVPSDVDDISPIVGDEREKLESEPKMFIGESIERPADITIIATPNRGPWLVGHHVKVTARMARETSKQEVEHVWRHFKAPGRLNDVKSEVKALSQVWKENWPHRTQSIKPVKMGYHDLVRYDTSPIHLAACHPLRVNAHLREVGPDHNNWISFEASGNNLMIGAVGVNLLNVIYARAQGYLG